MLRRVAVVVVALFALLGGLGLRAAMAGPVQDLAAMTNADRVSRNLRALSTADDLARVAQQRADEMTRAKRLAHTQNLGSKVSGWQRLGENVGRGPTLQEIQTAFMASPSHRENILDREFTQMGVGVTWDGRDYYYVAVVFRLPSGAQTASPPPPSTTPTTRASQAPKPTTTTQRPTTTTQKPTTTTTQPPTTTTTVPPPPPPPPVEEIAPPVESTTTTMETTTTTAPRPITKDPEFLAANFSDRIVPAAATAPLPAAPGRSTWPIVLAAVLGLLVGSASSAALRLDFKRSKA